jgi:hypothetical protein
MKKRPPLDDFRKSPKIIAEKYKKIDRQKKPGRNCWEKKSPPAVASQ